ncbi:MAG: tyrosine-type recombinase/integrase [Lachnospiraceae bacterium]|nr:tyrosine-type recombinase/integrase [Lachnospiraceae bacterium]
MAERKYSEQVNIDNALKLRELLKQMPGFAADYFRAIEPTTQSRTRIAYAYDMIVFFKFLKENNPSLKNTEIKDIRLKVLDELKAVDIEEYMDYLKYYNKGNTERVNTETGIKRKLVALRGFYKYFYKRELIENNPTVLIDIPKLHEKEIIRLDSDEVETLLNDVETGEGLSERAKKFNGKTAVRDLAIVTLMLGTGIRVSECVGLDINDVDFKNSGIRIHRKGGNEVIVYFGEEVEDALSLYLDERRKIEPVEGNEQALFLSLQRKRINVRSVENLVKKYARTVTTLKKITPHKLRSTYGTSLYKETGDIYLVADVLGHKDVNTTKKHYAAIDEDRRRSAADKVTLRKSN